MLDKILDQREVGKFLRRFTASSAPDQFGWRPFQHLRHILRLHDDHKQRYINLILKPIALGIPSGAFLEEYTRGGRFIPAAKSVEKSGIRPIVIGDLERRIVSSIFCRFYRKSLESHFTLSHSRVLQFCVGLEEGCLKFCKTIECLLGPHSFANPFTDQGEGESDNFDPTVIIMIDARNAFNEISRQRLFDILLAPEHRCENFSQGVLPYVHQYYGQAGKLFLKHQRETRFFSATTGVSQGDPLAMALFAHTTFPSLVKVAETFPDCVFPAYADNMAVIGKLSVAAQATASLVDTLKQELGLEIQPRDSQIFSSSWCELQSSQQQAIQEHICSRYPGLQQFAFRGQGIILGGIPIGSQSFQQEFITAKVNALNAELTQLEQFPIALGLKQLLKTTHVPTLQYFLRGISPALTAAQCKCFDVANLRLLAKVFQWPQNQAQEGSSVLQPAPGTPPSDLQFAYFKRQLPYSAGGDGFTPQEGVAYTAFWSATAKFLKWAGEIAIFQHWTFPTPPLFHRINPDTELRIRQPQQADAGDVVPMLAAFLDTHRHLMEQGISAYTSLAELPQACDNGWIPSPELFGTSGSVLFIPAQRELTAQFLSEFPRFRSIRAHLSERQRSLLAHHSSFSTPLRVPGHPVDELLSQFTPQRTIWHSTMESTNLGIFEQQPISLVAAADKFLHGLPVDLPPHCDRCHHLLRHPGGTTHMATCRHRSQLWTDAHEKCNAVLSTLIKDSGVRCRVHVQGVPGTRQNVSQHGPEDHHVGDFELPQLMATGGGWHGLILDFSMSHVFDNDAQRKIRGHRTAYALHVPPKAFLPIVASTDGLL